jgi:FtsP/CotA-like multicopper oxidase with cupredoxin domain
LSDWRLNAEGQLAAGFGNAMEAAMAGRIGNVTTVNGRVPGQIAVRAGEWIRLRLINTALARIMALRFEQHRVRIIALDGQPVVEPFDPENRRLLLGPAMRADLIIDMSGEPGRSYAVTDSFYGEDFTYTLVRLAYHTAPRLRDKLLDASIRLPANPVPEPDLKDPDRHALMLEGSKMSPRGPMMGMLGGGTSWAITRDIAGRAQSVQGMKPILTVACGRTCVLTLKNNTSWWHPIHLHGFSFRVLTRNGILVRRTWHDTLLMEPNETADIAFVADNPSD